MKPSDRLQKLDAKELDRRYQELRRRNCLSEVEQAEFAALDILRQRASRLARVEAEARQRGLESLQLAADDPSAVFLQWCDADLAKLLPEFDAAVEREQNQKAKYAATTRPHSPIKIEW